MLRGRILRACPPLPQPPISQKRGRPFHSFQPGRVCVNSILRKKRAGCLGEICEAAFPAETPQFACRGSVDWGRSFHSCLPGRVCDNSTLLAIKQDQNFARGGRPFSQLFARARLCQFDLKRRPSPPATPDFACRGRICQQVKLSTPRLDAENKPNFGHGAKAHIAGTVAILAQGTRRAVAVTQAFCTLRGSNPGFRFRKPHRASRSRRAGTDPPSGGRRCRPRVRHLTPRGPFLAPTRPHKAA